MSLAHADLDLSAPITIV